MIKVFVQKTMAKADIDTPLTSGSVGLEVEFVFSEDWSGLTKTAVFETSAFYKETAPLSTASTIVPADVMAWEEETLYIGVYGTAQNGEIVIPTVYANCGRIHKGANDSEGGRPLIPAQSDILQNQIDNLGGRVAWLEETGGGGGAGILLDTTLTQPGKAADAKAVGDALENVGGKAYVQDTEPAQMEVGEFWYNPDEAGGGSADLTGYATEAWVQEGYQPKGDYLTEQDLSGYAKSKDIPAKPSDIGAQPAGNYATKDAIPTTLPNPHKLTFSGAASAEYDGSEAVEVVIPQGGGGGSGGGGVRLVADGARIATGTIANGAAAWSGDTFGLNVGDLKAWKRLLLICNLGTRSTFNIQVDEDHVSGYSKSLFYNTAFTSQRHVYFLEWLDTDRTILGAMYLSDDAGFSENRESYVMTTDENGNPGIASKSLSPNNIYLRLPASHDSWELRWNINTAQTAEGTWSIYGILKYEEE